MFKSFQIIAILAVCAYASSVTSTIIEDVDPLLLQQQFVLKLVRRTYSSRVEVQPFEDDDDCFDYYLAEQDKVSKEYNKQYNICKATAQAAKDQLTAESSEKRTEVIKQGNAICSDLDDCTGIEDGLKFFECYSDASAANYPVLYNINVDSSAQVTNLKVFYQRIESDQKNCTTLAKNDYYSALAVCNSNLEKCLNGEPLPTTTKPTQEPTTTTTEEPVTTTTPEPEPTTSSSTEEPETTKTTPEPEPTTSSSTEEPETTTTTPEPEPTTSSSTEEPETTTTTPEPEPTTSSSTEEPETTTTTPEPEPTTSSSTEEPETTTTTREPEPTTSSTADPTTTEEEPSPEEDLFGLKQGSSLWSLFRKLTA